MRKTINRHKGLAFRRRGTILVMDEELWETMGEKITEVKTEKSEKITNKSENHRKTSTVQQC